MCQAVLQLLDLILLFEIILLDFGVLFAWENSQYTEASALVQETYEVPCGLLPAARHPPQTTPLQRQQAGALVVVHQPAAPAATEAANCTVALAQGEARQTH